MIKPYRSRIDKRNRSRTLNVIRRLKRIANKRHPLLIFSRHRSLEDQNNIINSRRELDMRVVDTLFNIRNDESTSHQKYQSRAVAVKTRSGLDMDEDHIHIPFTNIYGF